MYLIGWAVMGRILLDGMLDPFGVTTVRRPAGVPAEFSDGFDVIHEVSRRLPTRTGRTLPAPRKKKAV